MKTELINDLIFIFGSTNPLSMFVMLLASAVMGVLVIGMMMMMRDLTKMKTLF